MYEFHERSGDYNVGGSSRAKLVTAYREKRCASRKPWRPHLRKARLPPSFAA